MSIKEVKEQQKNLLESIGPIEDWVKCGFINIVDIQMSWMNTNEIERDIYSIGVRSCEHPNGYFTSDKIAPVFRIRHGKIIRDTGDRVDSFFWKETAYNKFKASAVESFFIGTSTGVYLENLWRIRKQLSDKDGEKLTYMVAQRHCPMEVIHCADEPRKVIVATEEICNKLGNKIINSWDESIDDASAIYPGDLIVQDIDGSGFYYRVDKAQASQTYERV